MKSKQKINIKSLDIRTPIQQDFSKCKKCGNPFLVEMREGENKKSSICNECLLEENQLNNLKVSSSIPSDFVKESFKDSKVIHKDMMNGFK
jgi:hypothetical protein